MHRFSSFFNSMREGNRNEVPGTKLQVELLGGFALNEKDHCCKRISQFVTAEAPE